MAIFSALLCANRTMSGDPTDMSTDVAWEEWGRREPYFGVITHPRYRRSHLNEDTKREFFDSGAPHVQYVLATIKRCIDPNFAPRSILDFGCGVGRLLLPFAAMAEEVVGVDVSQSMLQEARRNCEQRGLSNIRLLLSDDRLSTLTDKFDLIHSFIVFQHIPVERGRAILSKLLQHLRPGGVGAIHLTYSKILYAPTQGAPPPPNQSVPLSARRATPTGGDPEIQMNPYNVNQILFAMQCAGISRFHTEFTDHGGELGVFIFFRTPVG
jgi:SAM-dependent methyltransferase